MAIKLDPQNYRAYQIRGDSWTDKLDKTKGNRDYTRAIHLIPADSKGLCERAKLQIKIGDKMTALSTLNRVIEFDPSFYEAYILRGSLRISINGDNAGAVADSTKAIELHPDDYEPYQYRARSWDVKDKERAEEDFAKAVTLFPAGAKGYVPQGEEAVRKGDFRLAISYLSAAIKVKPDDEEAHSLLSRALAGEKRNLDTKISDQIKRLKSASKMGPGLLFLAFDFERRGEVLSAQGNYAGAKVDFLLADTYSEQAAEPDRIRVNKSYDEVSQSRNLNFLRHVRVLLKVAPKDKREYTADMMRFLPPDEEHGLELAYLRFGMTSPGENLREGMILGGLSNGGSAYDQYKQAVMFPPPDSDGQSNALVNHELTHALQDQHFNFDRIDNETRSNYDRRWAVYSLQEGDAVWFTRHPREEIISLVGSIPTQQKVFLAIDEEKRLQHGVSGPDHPSSLIWINEMLRLASTPRPEKPFADLSPDINSSSLYIHTSPNYGSGEHFVDYLMRHGGWAQVDRAYTQLVTSEQLIHPEKYLDGEVPVRVDIPAVPALLRRGWKMIRTNVVGELGYSEIINQYTNNIKEAEQAAEGWGGDRYAVYEGPKQGDVCLIQMTVWDTEKDAWEFFAAYEKRTLKRYPSAKSIDGISKPDRRVWYTNEGGVAMELRGKSVLIVEGAPATQ